MLEDHVKNDYQKLHAKMVASVMEFYADKFGEDKDLWYITGLLHDVDYFEYPQEHPKYAIKWLEEMNQPSEMIDAIRSHAYGHGDWPAPSSKLAKFLYAIDELSGLMYAYYLMRNKSFKGMAPNKVNKKLKDKAFAAKISRKDVNYGLYVLEEEFGIDRLEHFQNMIDVFTKMFDS